MHVLSAEIRCYFIERLICAAYPFLNCLVNYGLFQLTVHRLEQSIRARYGVYRSIVCQCLCISMHCVHKVVSQKLEKKYINQRSFSVYIFIFLHPTELRY